MGSLDELGAAIAKVAEGVNGSTVGVGNRWRGGSGIVLEKGKVLTNAHNLHGDEVHVSFIDGREADGKVLGVDSDGDLAVIGVDTGDTTPFGWGDAPAHHPVSCLSWFEADAYARYRGGRLPSEPEWEAARRAGLPGCGQVWEWTSSWFEPYPGFKAYPYDGYSTPWFGTHNVLRGGSWATHARLKRPSFRNWYERGFREIPAGVRCAGGL